MAKSPETSEGAPSVEAFRGIIEDSLGSAGITSKNKEGNLTFPFTIGNYRLTYTVYGPKPEGYGKQILWIDFKPTHALDIFVGDHDYLFALRSDNPTVIMRRFRSGGLVPKHGVPNLHTSTRALDVEETNSLLLFARAPHLHLSELPILFRLTEDEAAAKIARDIEVGKANEELYTDLAELARQRRRGPPNYIID
jgi:hypothetical protein